MSTDDFGRFDLLILGLSTWYDGDLQSDPKDIKKMIDVYNKKKIFLYMVLEKIEMIHILQKFYQAKSQILL